MSTLDEEEPDWFEAFTQRISNEMVEALRDPARDEAMLAEIKRRAATRCPSRYLLQPDDALISCELEDGHPGVHRDGERKWAIVAEPQRQSEQCTTKPAPPSEEDGAALCCRSDGQALSLGRAGIGSPAR